MFASDKLTASPEAKDCQIQL